MNKKEQIEILFRKQKTILLLLASLIFIVVGIWFLFGNPKFDNSILSNQTVLKLIGAFAILFFGTVGIFLASRLYKKLPGLVIDEHGITNNTNMIITGFVPWSHIEGIGAHQVYSQHFIILYVKNPKDYIKNTSNFYKKMSMWLDNKNYGSPIVFPTNMLKADFDDLYSLLQEKIDQFHST